MVNAKEIIPTRKKEGYCLTCSKKLSNFNLNKYCFLHTMNSLKKEDEELEKRIWMQALYYRTRKEMAVSKNPVNGKPYRRHSKLNEKIVKAIRKSKLTMKELAKKYKVHFYTIKDILNKRTWIDV